MSRLMENYHALTGRPLPMVWSGLDSYERNVVCRYWNSRHSSKGVPVWYNGYIIWKSFKGYWSEIYTHLQAIGLISEPIRDEGKSYVQAMVAEAYEKAAEGVETYRRAYPQLTKMWIDEASKIVNSPMLYERPNGGKRMLPSVYGQLKGDQWLRANRVTQNVSDMNDGHIEATLNLLKESHGNVVDKSTTLLGKMWRHYQNQPEIQKRLEELCLMMQKVEVHEMYPIFKTLVQEQQSRRPAHAMLDIETLAIDDTIKEW